MKRASHRSSILRGLSVVGGLLAVATACNGAESENAPPNPEDLAQLAEEFRHHAGRGWHHGHSHDGDSHHGRGHDLFCGGNDSVACDDDKVCLSFLGGSCPGPGNIGVCLPQPRHCPPVTRPVCGCDGNTYNNYCDALQAGAAVEHRGECAPEEPEAPTCGNGVACPGSGTCADDPGDECTGRDCPGVCECKTEERCGVGEAFNSDASVCACVPVPCADIKCPPRTECVVQDDGTPACM